MIMQDALRAARVENLVEFLFRRRRSQCFQHYLHVSGGR